MLPKVMDRLSDLARRRGTIAYRDLAAPLGLLVRTAPRLLGRVQAACLHTGVPDLSALVVRMDTGRPGDGFFAPCGLQGAAGHVREKKWDEVRSAVYAHDWTARPLR